MDTNPQTLFNRSASDRIWTLSEGKLKIPPAIESGWGYWVFCRHEISLEIPIQQSGEKEIELHSGQWNLIAAVKKESISPAAVNSVVWGWNRDHFQAFHLEDSLVPLNGYFLFGIEDSSALITIPNFAPVANAGPDQRVLVNSLVTLDGSLSTDVNEDILTFHWRLLSKPLGSSTDLSGPMVMNPTFFIDLPGVYVVELIVSDGMVDSAPDTVMITIDASKQTVIDLNAIEPNQGALTRIYGSTGDGRKGVPVAGGFDCDGDGFSDTAFSAIKASPLERREAGEVALIFGNGSIGEIVDTAGFQKDVLKISGVQPFEVTGAEIWMDDVNGDGMGDLLICRQNYTPAAGRAGAGALSIVLGNPTLRTYASALQYLDLSSPPDNVSIVTFVGAKAYDRLGIWVRTGDITGDNVADIVVGADEVDGNNPREINRGAVYVIRGGPHLAMSSEIDFANVGSSGMSGHIARIDPPPGSEEFHIGATCQIADLDGNGRGEVLMSAALNRAGAGIRLPEAPENTGMSVGGSTDGTLFIAWDDNFPVTPWVDNYVIPIAAPELGTRTIIEGAKFNRAFGEEILGGLDYDGDNMPDLLVGDLTADPGNGSNSGSAHLFFRAQNLRDRVFNMETPPEDISFTLIKGPVSGALSADTVAQGDFNGDGFADLAIGNPHDNPNDRSSSGSMHILLGQLKAWPETIDLSFDKLPTPDKLRIIRIDGAHGSVQSDTGDTLCYSAATADLDNDGYTDIIVNEMAGNGLAPNAIDVGNLLLLNGAAFFGNFQR